jgi:hypothetical protein
MIVSIGWYFPVWKYQFIFDKALINPGGDQPNGGQGKSGEGYTDKHVDFLS